ncbi:effector-associated domain EAD1-containing protein [Floridanema evergladense]|uniref:Effector-associated domain EAD1-containing protein n=1 Tax=Floridaenema evergladense BLCC-F167 TaxID=3153639 RepID=A0ABV4WRR3_9CYAN
MIKILFLAANPSDTTRLKLERESRSIDRALRQAEFRDRFEIIQHWAVRVGDLQELLLRHKPDIVHFSGHGSAASEIILEDNLGKSHPVSVRALSQLFCILKDNIRCVVLNACYSKVQAQAIAEHIDSVVGMSKAITDDAAISFATAFYQGLGYGRDLKTAFDLGCVQIDMENLGQQDTPQIIALKCSPTSIFFTNDIALEIKQEQQKNLDAMKKPPFQNPSSNALMLNNEQRKKLREALISAFPTESDLIMLLEYELDLPLNTIAGGSNYTQLMFNVVKWFDSQGKMRELIHAARRANLGNPKLQEFIEEIGLVDI